MSARMSKSEILEMLVPYRTPPTHLCCHHYWTTLPLLLPLLDPPYSYCRHCCYRYCDWYCYCGCDPPTPCP